MDAKQIAEMIEKNPAVNREEFIQGMRATQALRDQGVEYQKYSLSPPFSEELRRGEHDTRSVYIR